MVWGATLTGAQPTGPDLEPWPCVKEPEEGFETHKFLIIGPSFTEIKSDPSLGGNNKRLLHKTKNIICLSVCTLLTGGTIPYPCLKDGFSIVGKRRMI